MNVTVYIVTLVITIVIFLVCREIVCWYLKINKSMDNQAKIIEQQGKIIEILSQLAQRKEESPNKQQSRFGDLMGRTVKVSRMSGPDVIGTVEYNSDVCIIIRTDAGSQKIYPYDIKSVDIV